MDEQTCKQCKFDHEGTMDEYTDYEWRSVMIVCPPAIAKQTDHVRWSPLCAPPPWCPHALEHILKENRRA
jgi:hypothetical protein